MHHSEIAGWILVILAVVFVPAMYWIGRGRDLLGVRRPTEAADENKNSSKLNSDLEPSNKEDEKEDHPQGAVAPRARARADWDQGGPDSPTSEAGNLGPE
jgi:hypothetical protein